MKTIELKGKLEIDGMVRPIGISIPIGGVAVTVGDSDPTELVDWTTWGQVTSRGGVPQKTGNSDYIVDDGENEITLNLEAGRHVFVVAIPATFDSSVNLFVDGVSATRLDQFKTTGENLYTAAYTYDVPSAGSYTVEIANNTRTTNWLNPALSIHKVADDATVTASAGQEQSVTASGQDVIFASMTINQPAYAPDGSTEFVEEAQIDVRADENYLLRTYTSISSDITADADYPGGANSFVTMVVEVS